MVRQVWSVRYQGELLGLWDPQCLKIVILVENHPQKRDFRCWMTLWPTSSPSRTRAVTNPPVSSAPCTPTTQVSSARRTLRLHYPFYLRMSTLTCLPWLCFTSPRRACRLCQLLGADACRSPRNQSAGARAEVDQVLSAGSAHAMSTRAVVTSSFFNGNLFSLDITCH